jgi:hypothetical protein
MAFGATTLAAPSESGRMNGSAVPGTYPRVGPRGCATSSSGKRTANTHARFDFLADVRDYKVEYDGEVGITFKCKLDQKPLVRCRSPFEADLKPGRTF